MVQYYEVRLSGAGGQGMMLAGTFLAEAAGIYDNKYIALTKSYGPESRGGASRAEVIISSDPIVFPEVENPDLLLAMTQEACEKYCQDVKPGGIIIVDSDFVQKPLIESIFLYEIPLTRIAREEVGSEITANVVALGAFASIVNWVSGDALRKAILSRTPKGAEALNEKAFKVGYSAAQQLNK